MGLRCSGLKRGAECGVHRQSIGEDERKGGINGYDAGKKIWAQASHPGGHHRAELGGRRSFGGYPGSGRSEGSFREDQERPPAAAVGLGRWRYAGTLVEWVKSECGWVLEIVKRTDDVKGFKLLPRRWVVERTFTWLGRFRRMSKDFEFHPETFESMISLAMINIMVRRLAAA